MSTQDRTTAFVYFITVDLEHIKIGATRDLGARLREFQTAHHQEVQVLYTIECQSREHALELEATLHSFYSRFRVRNEWFKIPLLQISSDIQLMVLLSKGATIRRHSYHTYLSRAVPHIDAHFFVKDLAYGKDMSPPPLDDYLRALRHERESE